jgi:hypothetical protein
MAAAKCVSSVCRSKILRKSLLDFPSFCSLLSLTFDPRVHSTSSPLHTIMSGEVLTELSTSICGAVVASENKEKRAACLSELIHCLQAHLQALEEKGAFHKCEITDTNVLSSLCRTICLYTGVCSCAIDEESRSWVFQLCISGGFTRALLQVFDFNSHQSTLCSTILKYFKVFVEEQIYTIPAHEVGQA